MNRHSAQLLTLLLFTSVPIVAQTQRSVPVRWDWLVVSTPDFTGPFRGNAPGFKAPVPKEPLPKTLSLTRESRTLGQFEVIVTTEGDTVLENTLSVSGPEVENRAKEALSRWRFESASLDGTPIRVRLRVFLEGG